MLAGPKTVVVLHGSYSSGDHIEGLEPERLVLYYYKDFFKATRGDLGKVVEGHGSLVSLA